MISQYYYYQEIDDYLLLAVRDDSSRAKNDDRERNESVRFWPIPGQVGGQDHLGFLE
jgi:hypothetical protein